MALALLVLAPSGVFAQGNGHSGVAASRPESRPSDQDPDSRGTTRPVDPVEQAITDLRRSQDAVQAGLSAGAAYKLGPEARRQMLDLCQDRTLPDAAFQGIVGVFEFERDHAVVDMLIGMLAGGGGDARDKYITDRLRALDAQKSMLPGLFARLEQATTPQQRRTILRALAEVVDLPAERMQAARFLIEAFTRPEFDGHATDLNRALKQITFHDHTQPARWQKWFDDFAATHKSGFSDADLYRSALREQNQRLVAEVKRSISIAVANKQAPDYFSPAQYPEAAIRAHAAQEFASLRDASSGVVRQAVRLLTDGLKLESNEEVTCAMIRALGSLAEGKDDLKAEVGPGLVPHIRDARDAVAIEALKALARTGTGADDDCTEIESLYERRGTDAKNAAVRAQVVTTLYSLDCGSPTIVKALADPSVEVRSSAARGLGYGKRKEAAPAIADALRIEKNEDCQGVMVRALIAIKEWPPEVVDALIDSADKPGSVSEAAVRGLVQAASAGALDDGRVERVTGLFSQALPSLLSSPDKRKTLLDDFQNAKGAVAARLVLTWLEAEAQPDTGRELAGILTRAAGPEDGDRLLAHATSLMTHGRAAAAVVLLRAALERPSGGAATRPARVSEIRVLLARALLAEKTPEGLSEAEVIASQELRLKPEDGTLLLLRGSIREALGRRVDAADDLQRALATEGVVMADAQRQEVERRTAKLLLADDPKKARTFLEGLPQRAPDRDLLMVKARVATALGEASKAIEHLRAALRAPGKADLNVVRFRLAEALFASTKAADRIEGAALVQALEAEPPLGDGLSTAALHDLVHADEAARDALAVMDAATPDAAADARRAVVALGDTALPWLFHELVELARSAGPVVLDRRAAAATDILVSNPAASRPAILAPPSLDAPREQWMDFATRATEWWDRRR